jgi:hypothetical protein
MATGKLIGADDATATSVGTNLTLVARFQAVATGAITEFKIKCTAAGQAKVAIYADSSGSPGARLVYNNTAQNVVVGWNTLSIPELEVIEGTYYWLALRNDASGVSCCNASVAGTQKYNQGGTFSTFTWPDPAGSFSYTYDKESLFAGFGILVISPSGLSQPISYGTPKLNLSIKPSGLQQPIAYGTPTVTVEGAPITIYPPGLQVVIAYGAPALHYPQTIFPPGLNVPIACGTPTLIFSGAAVIYVPGYQQPIGYGTPTLLKYVFHLILDGQYNIESPETNRAYVIGRDIYGNPVYGEAHDSDESSLVGERLDFQQELAIPTTAQAADVAAAVLSKMRLSKKRGVILIPYNCGQELWDVVQITDAGANQSAVKFRVVGLRFEYHPKQARYQHKLILGAP